MHARTTILLLASAAALAACGSKADEQNIVIDNGVATNADLANADVEALPPDESSETPTNELVNGDDQPDVNDLGNSD